MIVSSKSLLGNAIVALLSVEVPHYHRLVWVRVRGDEGKDRDTVQMKKMFAIWFRFRSLVPILSILVTRLPLRARNGQVLRGNRVAKRGPIIVKSESRVTQPFTRLLKSIRIHLVIRCYSAIIRRIPDIQRATRFPPCVGSTRKTFMSHKESPSANLLHCVRETSQESKSSITADSPAASQLWSRIVRMYP